MMVIDFFCFMLYKGKETKKQQNPAFASATVSMQGKQTTAESGRQ